MKPLNWQTKSIQAQNAHQSKLSMPNTPKPKVPTYPKQSSQVIIFRPNKYGRKLIFSSPALFYLQPIFFIWKENNSFNIQVSYN